MPLNWELDYAFDSERRGRYGSNRILADSGSYLCFQMIKRVQGNSEDQLEAPGFRATLLMLQVERVSSELVAYPERFLRARQELSRLWRPSHGGDARWPRRTRGALNVEPLEREKGGFVDGG